jgi:group I intron endonuclease
MNKYSEGKIYKLINISTGESYVGSTYLKLARRFTGHKYEARKNRWQHNKLYNNIRQYGEGHFKMELIELCNCNNKIELLAREQHFIDNLKPALNSATATSKNKERSEYDRIYIKKCKESMERYKTSLNESSQARGIV